MDFRDIMIDLETLSTEVNATILSLGACFFSPITGVIGKTYYREITIQSNLDSNRHISASTIQWWFNQSNSARAIFSEDRKRVTLKETTCSFNKFITAHSVPDKLRLWSNSPNFDEVILNTAYKDVGTPWLLNFWNTADVRTVKRLCPEAAFKTYLNNNPRSGAHNALSDALFQAQYVSWILRNAGCKELY